MEDDARDPEDATAAPIEPVEGDDPSASPLDPAVVREFLGAPDAFALAQNAVRRIVPREAVDELAADALVRALTAPPPRLERVLPAWLSQISRRVAIRWLEKRRRRAKYESPMPRQAAGEDAYTGESVDDEDDFDTGYLPGADDEPGDRLGAHLDRLIGAHVRDQETRAILRQHAEEAQSYAAIAAARGLTEAQVANRILRFKKKYAPRVKRRRELLVVLKLFGAAALTLLLVALAWWLLHRPPEIGPDPSRDEAPPSPSASAAVPVFDQAQPTQPAPREKPEPRKPPP